jgi:hypothetical protein
MRPTRLRIVALLTSVALLLPESAFARVHYFCQMMDLVMESACCCGNTDSDHVEGQAEARRPDCCARVTAPSRSVAPSAPDTTAPVPTATLLATIAEPVHVPLPVSTVGTAPKLARGPPPVGPLLFIVHCSYLI